MSEPRCPLCGHDRTHFLMTPTCERQFEDQQCSNCEEPCKNWPAVQALKAELERCKARIAELERERETYLKSLLEWNLIGQDNERLKAELAAVKDAAESEEEAHMQTIDERDDAEDWADKLAYAVGGIDEIGEHSNLNCPWTNALEILERSQLTQAEPRPTPGAGDDGENFADSTWLESVLFYWFDDCGMVRELYNGWELTCSVDREGMARTLNLIATTYDPKRSTKLQLIDDPTRNEIIQVAAALGVELGGE